MLIIPISYYLLASSQYRVRFVAMNTLLRRQMDQNVHSGKSLSGITQRSGCLHGEGSLHFVIVNMKYLVSIPMKPGHYFSLVKNVAILYTYALCLYGLPLCPINEVKITI